MSIEIDYNATTDEYWDCGCDSNYIHPKTETVCSNCGAEYNEETAPDYPDSIYGEVIKAGFFVQFPPMRFVLTGRKF